MTFPWDRNEGRFDRPSSGVPVPASRAQAKKPVDHVTKQLLRAAHDGVIPSGSDTIALRIEQAIGRLKADGLGDAKAIYLTEADMLALRELTLEHEWQGIRLAIGVKSMVYGRGGARAILKRVRKSPA